MLRKSRPRESVRRECVPPPRLRRAARFLAPKRAAVAAVLLFALSIAALNACEPLVLKYVFDRVGGQRGLSAVGLGVAAMLVLGLLREGLVGIQNWLTWKTRIEVQYWYRDSR